MDKKAGLKRFWFSTVMLFSAAAFAQQQRGAYKDVRELPDTPAGKAIWELLDVVNANDPERVRAFVKERFTPKFREFAPIEEHLDVFAEVFSNSHGLDLYGIRKYEEKTPDNEIVAILKNRLTGSWQAFVLQVEPEPPHRIAVLQFAPARPPSDAPPMPKLSDAEMARELEIFLKKLADLEAFSGAVLLAKNGQYIYKGAFGLASRRYKVPDQVDTKFNLGSMNKMFTGVAIAQLAQQGKLSFDDPVSKYLSSEWLPRETADKIQIRHLLTHTSGLGSYFNDEFMNGSRERFRTVEDFRPLVADKPPDFEPGTDWQYSNSGFLLLGAIIEKVTGKSYFEHIREALTKPAGMVNTDSYDMDEPVPNLAMGHFRDRGPQGTRWMENTFKHSIRGGPAGGGFSTVEDLLKFDIALRSHKLLNEEFTKTVLTAKPELGSPEYGYGFGISGTPDNRIVGHTGGFPGISASFHMHLDSGYTVIVLSNMSGGSQPVESRIREWLANRP